MRNPAELADLFRTRGLKVTPQRQRIFHVLADNVSHPTAQSVHAAVRAEMPTISLKTVYQTLNDLAAMGEIQHLDLGTGSGRFDPNVEPHHHLVCVGCGDVRDLQADYSHLRIPPGQQQGFSVTAVEVVFRGFCETCNSKRKGVIPNA